MELVIMLILLWAKWGFYFRRPNFQLLLAYVVALLLHMQGDFYALSVYTDEERNPIWSSQFGFIVMASPRGFEPLLPP